MRGSTMHVWLLALVVFCATGVLAAMALFIAIAKPVTAVAPDYSVVTVGGLSYEAALARPIELRDPFDASMVSGMPAGDRRLRSGQILFGAFIDVTNHSLRSVPAAARIDLRDEFGHVYRPLHLPATNPYAYVPRAIPPKTRVPRNDSPASENLTATGQLLLFRIPAGSYESGALELLIHDSRQHGHVASLIV